MAAHDEYFGPLLAVVLAAVGIWAALRISKGSSAVAAPVNTLPPGTVVNPTPQQNATLSKIESGIPIVGPIVSPMINSAGNAIVKNQFLESHSQVGPNPGQTEASAGIAGVTFIPNGGIKWSTVGHGIEKGADAVGSAAKTVGHYINPLNW